MSKKPGHDMTEEALELIAARFRLLSEAMRLKILRALEGGEKTVGDLVEATGTSQANVSKHLSLLLDSGVVARRKEGLFAYYRIADATIFELCRDREFDRPGLACASVCAGAEIWNVKVGNIAPTSCLHPPASA